LLELNFFSLFVRTAERECLSLFLFYLQIPKVALPSFFATTSGVNDDEGKLPILPTSLFSKTRLFFLEIFPPD